MWLGYFASDRSSFALVYKIKIYIYFIRFFYFDKVLSDYLFRRVITRYVRKGGKLWIRIFPDKPITFRAAETRMGSGKGNVEYWVAVVKPGKILYEIAGISESMSKSALRIAAYKMPVLTRILGK